MGAGLSTFQWGVLAGMVVLFGWGEGYLALWRVWVPRVVGRLRELRGTAWPYQVAAPLFVMSLVGDRPRAMLRAWLGVTAIVAAVLLIRLLPEPWRGIVDLSVAVALVVGVAAMVRQAAAVIR